MTLTLTWWGHATATVDMGPGSRVLTDPVFSDRLLHLRRDAPTPGPEAARADLVLVSHRHHDHLHLPSLSRTAAVVVVPRGAEALLPRSRRRTVVPAAPGDVLDVAGVRVEVLAATHDGRRHPLSRGGVPALGFRVSGDAGSWWYPGDTELRDDLGDVAPVDLALVPIGGWGPTLGEGHLDPGQAAEAVRRVGAAWTVPVHWGTFWPRGLRRLAPRNHQRLFVTPGERFAAAMSGAGTEVVVVAPGATVTR